VAAVPASFGHRLADAAGWTLYTFSGDTWNTSACTGRCSEVWQPVRSLGGKPQPGSGIAAPLVGSLQRDDGSEQVSFAGHPLYRYSGDEQPGTTGGRDLSSFGGTWSPDAHQPALAVKP
jgi:predicted lipoprotein with Yx(FWY)xxD motif